MKKPSLANRLKYLMFDPHYPDVGIEIDSNCIRLAVVSADKGSISLKHFDSEELPEGAVEISPLKLNVQKLDVVAEALKSIWSRNRFQTPKICLLLQDRAALTFHVQLEHPAANRQECLDLIRFKLRKSVPFRIEEAQITYFDASGSFDPSAGALWVTLINQTVLRQYEQVIQSSIDTESGLVDLATFNLLNLSDWAIRREGLTDEDLLYVNLARDYVSIAITQKGKLSFFRTRELEKRNGIVEEALAEIYPATMYYIDKLAGSNLAQAFIHSSTYAEELCAQVEKSLQLKPVTLTPESFAGTQFDPTTLHYLDSFSPLLGLITSRKVEFL